MTHDILFIQSLYAPLQPLRREAGLAMDYIELEPLTALKPYVYCFWELKTKTGTEFGDTEYTIVADGCVDLIFALHAREAVLISVSGTEADSFSFSENVHYMGIRFYPATIHFFFDLSLEGLSSLTSDAGTILGEQLAQVYEGVFTASDQDTRILLLNEFLFSRFNDRKFEPDARLLYSLKNIFSSNGNAAIQKEVAGYISPRQQRRLFEQYTGLTPKNLSKIIRFQKVLSQLLNSQKNRVEILHEFGYYDQSHFIRDFKQFYGDTPRNLF